MKIRQALIKSLPEIIRESVKPLEQIEGIKIVQVAGLNASGASGGVAGTNGATSNGQADGSLADQVVNSALRYRGQAPLVDSLLREIGLDGATTHGLTQALRPAPPAGSLPTPPNVG